MVENATIDKPPRIRWVRSPVSKECMQGLTKSDTLAWAQAGGHTTIWLSTGSATVAAAVAGEWFWFAILLAAHGVVSSFLTNGIHELAHGTVFESERLNRLFLNAFCVIRWINPRAFWASHRRHHAFTLYPPYDLEVTVPSAITPAFFLRRALIDPVTMIARVRLHWAYARGRLPNAWDRAILDTPKLATRNQRWSQYLLAFHSLVLALSLATGQWAIFVVVSLTPGYGGLLFYLCNETQHSGMKGETPDFRESCRTIRLNPVLEFLYWRMNFHAEHHMYPNVPCYRLSELHREVRADLPSVKRGLLAVWREIFERQRLEAETEPTSKTKA